MFNHKLFNLFAEIFQIVTQLYNCEQILVEVLRRGRRMKKNVVKIVYKITNKIRGIILHNR